VNNHITQGIVLILASVTIMAFGDALAKLLSDSVSVWQIFLVRSLLALPLLAVFALFVRSSLHIESLGWVALRGFLLLVTWLVYYASYPVLDLTIAAVILYTNPILTVLLAALFLRERVSIRQWLGVFLGFLGVVLIIRPGSEGFTWFAILPLMAALLYSITMLLTRTKCQNESPLVMAFSFHIGFVIAGAAGIAALSLLSLPQTRVETFPFLLDTWGELGPRGWMLLALMSVLAALFVIGVARAYQITPPPIVATFDYG